MSSRFLAGNELRAVSYRVFEKWKLSIASAVTTASDSTSDLCT